MLRLEARVKAVIKLRDETEARVNVVRVVADWRVVSWALAAEALGRRARVGRVRWARVYDVPYVFVRECIQRDDGKPRMIVDGGKRGHQ